MTTKKDALYVNCIYLEIIAVTLIIADLVRGTSEIAETNADSVCSTLVFPLVRARELFDRVCRKNQLQP